MRFANFLLLLPLLVSLVGAELRLPSKFSKYTIASSACKAYIPTVATVCEPMMFGRGRHGGRGRHAKRAHGRSSGSPCHCKDTAGFGTMSQCLVQGYNNNSEIINGFVDSCVEMGIPMTLETFYQNYTKTQKLVKNVTEIENFNTTELVDFPVALDFQAFKQYHDSYQFYRNNYNLSNYFGSGLLGYWAVVLIIASIVNWTIRLFPSITKHFTGPVSRLYRKYITLTATIRRKKTNEQKLGFFDCLVPSRMETFICLGFLAMTVAACSAQMRRVEGGSVVYTTWIGELARYMADRTGIVISYAFPLLILFAGRNNFLQWVTRWNFATFITYHRWVSRIVVLVVFIHAITFSISDAKSGRYYNRMKRDFMQWGTVAAISGGIILIQGMMYFRRRWYETFLLIHIIFATFFVVGAYKHTVGLGYGAFYWAAIAVWALDRVMRLCRIIVFGVPQATVTLLADETLRIVVPKPRYWKSIPGGHAFIHFVRPSCFWQSHPFTFTDSPNSEGKIVLYVKIKGGVTHGFTQQLLNSPGKTAKIRVLIEGPYGEPSGARHYKNAVFVAGGNGIPGIYSECVDLAKRQNDRQSLKLIWVIREWKSLSWFFEELRRLKSTKVDTTIYVTKPESTSGLEYFEGLSSGSDNSSLELENKEMGETKEKEMEMSSRDSPDASSMIRAIRAELSHITFKEGRPSIESMVKEEVSETDGSVAFITCGHPVMVDDLRYSVIQNMENTNHRIEYFEQLQVWA